MNSRRLMSVVVLSSLSVAVLGNEWIIDFSGGVFFWIHAMARLVPPLALLVFGLATGALWPMRFGLRIPMLLAVLVIPATLLFVSLSSDSASYTQETLRDTLLSVALALLVAKIGHWIAWERPEVEWLLSKLALLLAIAAAYDILVRATGFVQSPHVLRPSWLLGLFLVYAYGWYLSAWLRGSRHRIGSFFALAACGGDIVMAFHKPVIFMTAVATVTVVLLSLRELRALVPVLRRTLIVAAVGAAGFVMVDLFLSSRASEYVRDTVFEKFLRLDYGRMPRSPEEYLERAAGGRFAIWQSTIEKTMEDPWFGHGFGQRVSVPATADRPAIDVYIHNIYLETLVSVGFIGALPLLAAMVWWFALVLRRMTAIEASHLLVPCFAYAVALLAYGMGGALWAFFTPPAALLGIMGVALGIADRCRAGAACQTRPTPMLRVPPAAVVRRRWGSA